MIGLPEMLIVCQARKIKELEAEKQKLHRIVSGTLPLGTTVFCIVGGAIVKGYVFAYEDVFHIRTKTVTRVIKVSIDEEDGIIDKSLSEVGKTIFTTYQEAANQINRR